jgi:predicted Zn-dependent peptidase
MAVASDAGTPPGGPASIVRRLHLPELTQVRLANGLTVVLEEDHRAPFVAMRLSYEAGSSHDPRGKTGLATLTQRMMTMTTKHLAAGMYERWLDRIGATDRGWRTTLDWTSIWATVPTSTVPIVLWLWSDQMGFFAPDDPKLLVEAREISKNQHSENVDNVAYGDVTDIELRALYSEGHPYSGVFSPAAIDRMTAADLREFHDRRYAPNTAVLVLSGDFRSGEVLERIRTYFDPIPPSPIEAPAIAPAALEASARLEVAANVTSPVVYMSWRTPAFLDAGDGELGRRGATPRGTPHLHARLYADQRTGSCGQRERATDLAGAWILFRDPRRRRSWARSGRGCLRHRRDPRQDA